MYIIIAAVLLTFALFLFWQSVKYKKSAGLPKGRVIYSDSHEFKELDRILYDASISLVGKPDYIVEQEGSIIPVEIKSNKIKTSPYDSHVLQLAAYCRLVDASFNIRPGFGILRYPNRSFKIKYTMQSRP